MAARLRKYREATLVRADGVVRPAKSLGLNIFAELTTPSAALRWLRNFLFMPQPPLLFKEGNMLARKFIHTFIDHPYKNTKLPSDGEAVLPRIRASHERSRTRVDQNPLISAPCIDPTSNAMAFCRKRRRKMIRTLPR